MRLNRFEEIEAWKAARMLVNCVYDAIRENADFRKDFRLVNQIQGAAVSSMSNIAEGFSRQSNKEFIQFLFIAKSSAAEVQSQLYVALDQKYLTPERFDEVYQHAESVSKLTSGFIKYLKTTLNEQKPAKIKTKIQQTQQTQ
jgi:four helix bundle protein